MYGLFLFFAFGWRTQIAIIFRGTPELRFIAALLAGLKIPASTLTGDQLDRASWPALRDFLAAIFRGRL